MATEQIATLGGGCFWCLEAVYQEMEGVLKVVSGYMGGHVANPTYEQVCSGDSGHVEVSQVTFDPNTASYEDILQVFFAIHDPDRKSTRLNSSHLGISYAVFCLKKKKKTTTLPKFTSRHRYNCSTYPHTSTA